MIRPRWQGLSRSHRWSSWRRWDQAIALLAATNLVWVIFDVSYIPLRNFWLQRNLYPLAIAAAGGAPAVAARHHPVLRPD